MKHGQQGTEGPSKGGHDSSPSRRQLRNARSERALEREIHRLSARVAELERRLAASEGTQAPADVVPLRHRRGPNPAGG